MFYKKLGNSGLKVSSLGLGAMNFGRRNWGCDEKTSTDIINCYIDAGGNFIDLADMYADGLSEEFTGRAIKGKRKEIILATKCGVPMPGSILNHRGSSRINIVTALENSLKRIGTDYIDLYYLHFWDPTTPFLESLSTLTNLINSGKVRYIGVSNYTGWQISEVASLWKNNKMLEPVIAMQSQYSLICRGTEFEVIPSCLYNNIGLVCWSPLGGGLLAGVYNNNGTGPKNERYTGSEEYPKKGYSFTKRNLAIVKKIGDIAKKLDIALPTLAVSWVLNRPSVASVLLGPKNVEHLKISLDSLDLVIPKEILNKLEEISRPEKLYPYCEQEKYIPDYFGNINY